MCTCQSASRYAQKKGPGNPHCSKACDRIVLAHQDVVEGQVATMLASATGRPNMVASFASQGLGRKRQVPIWSAMQ